MLLLDDASLRKKIALRGKRDAKEKYSIEKCADRMLDIYREALEKKQRGIQ
jgi:glycosyltransferase involved in cell wall biosynthesis